MWMLILATIPLFDRMQDLPENHFRVSGASGVNIFNLLLILSLLLLLKLVEDGGGGRE